MHPGPSTGLPRGGAVGALVGLLSVAAHGVAGGGYPDSPEFALLLTVSVAAGCAATGLPHLTGRDAGRGIARLLGALAAGQLAGHAVLAGLGHAHGQRDSHIARGDAPPAGFLPTGWMLGAHVLATLGCAVVILAAERLYAVVSRAVRATLGAPGQVAVASAERWSDPPNTIYRFASHGPIGPRAPPAPA
ncbi:hypothetical protein APR12_003891 [Nocardia amikacinitolerans]|uniref:hypothetical protein n=1 Tax=Nocardia amikacinitolerans TaxID=756689 RepID=UPI00083690E7|nr:hypothetical protein [Nocardia amikacinitolerans]MCP2318536.1 hypothetical protein [Nocardia amikacinitolerans]